MTRIGLEVHGLDQLVAKFQRLPREVKGAISDAVTTSALLIQRMSRQESPIDSGRLRNSIHIRYIPLGAIVSTNVKYAVWVHEGTGIYARGGNGRKSPWAFTKGGKTYFTHGNKANPFMERSAVRSKDDIQAAFERAIKRVTEGQ